MRASAAAFREGKPRSGHGERWGGVRVPRVAEASTDPSARHTRPPRPGDRVCVLAPATQVSEYYIVRGDGGVPTGARPRSPAGAGAPALGAELARTLDEDGGGEGREGGPRTARPWAGGHGVRIERCSGTGARAVTRRALGSRVAGEKGECGTRAGSRATVGNAAADGGAESGDSEGCPTGFRAYTCSCSHDCTPLPGRRTVHWPTRLQRTKKVW